MQGGKKGGGGGHVARTKVPGGPVQEDTIVQYLYKTKMCYHWQSGYCLMGNNCNFAHGIHELRIPRSFTVVNEQVRDVTPAQPETVFNRELNPAALGPAGQRCACLHPPDIGMVHGVRNTAADAAGAPLRHCKSVYGAAAHGARAT